MSDYSLILIINQRELLQYSLLGQTGLAVSRLAFGAMTFSDGNNDIASVYKVDAALANELVSVAWTRVNLFDTADAYAGGESESLLGKALKHRRQEAVITTKVGFRSGQPLTQAGLSRRHILCSVDQSLHAWELTGSMSMLFILKIHLHH